MTKSVSNTIRPTPGWYLPGRLAEYQETAGRSKSFNSDVDTSLLFKLGYNIVIQAVFRCER